MNSRTD